MNDILDFLAGLMPQYDRVLLVGDFNIHVLSSPPVLPSYRGGGVCVSL